MDKKNCENKIKNHHPHIDRYKCGGYKVMR